ncbi:MAG: zinc-ribbon domain-containing protein [Candidatus Aegiribacteria sp.]|nr:zinc-ribbon domain-containing protein [Candidatus Aegiribacteria sp.]
MIVNCPNCDSKYNIPENKIGDSPKRFRCRKCSEIFIISPPKDIKDGTADISIDEDSEEQRAARFARVLASDILIYNRELIDEARKDGNLPEVMNQEIQKSWDLWKSRFPEDSERDPDIFSDALNQYLADGEKIFRSQDYS